MSRPRILVTNDDGILAPGIEALARAMEALGEVTVVAPERESSAVSHGFTMNRPLRPKRLGERRVALDGLPVDCVIFALRDMMIDSPPDLVVSGINSGPNLGCDVYYSGTVAAAHEGRINGVPSIAVSIDTHYSGDPGAQRGTHYDTAGEMALRVGREVLRHGLPADVLLNLNVPNLPLEALRGLRITRVGKRVYQDRMIRRTDPRGGEYYWVGGEPPFWVEATDTDFQAIIDGYVSLSPIRFEVNEPAMHEALRGWDIMNGRAE